MTRVVIIGARGFIGSHIASELHDLRPECPPRSAADLEDPQSLRALLKSGDVVINAAGYAVATDATKEGSRRFDDVNVSGARNLAEAARERGASQLIHISSVAAMGRLQGRELPETASGPLITPYARSKRAAEVLLAEFAADLPVTILRPTSVFGEGRGLAALLCRLLMAPVVPLPGGGRAEIPFTYVGNVAWAVRLCLGNSLTYGRTLQVGDRRSYELRLVLKELAAALGRNPRFVPVPQSIISSVARVGEAAAKVIGKPPPIDRTRLSVLTTSVSFSIEQLHATTGYEPRHSLREGAARIAAWYLASRAPGHASG
ncbi:MAG TPA: NAD-dependent epimerase/dehydratase family protein [Candidatus Limnocylindrales bacterium]|nr:NAD-dependent epimerase/dehydratase family protein [Candidatus Limnocylindrales bacterium]